MIDLILLLLINALAIIGIYLSFGKDMIFEKFGRAIESKINYALTKPLFNCPTCMSSVHSVLPFWYQNDFCMDSAVTYIIYVPALAALSTWIANKIVEE